MIELISGFLENDIAYVISDGVYLDVSRVPDYGLLAGQPLDSLRAGDRVEAVGEKAFATRFRAVEERQTGEPSWPAPFAKADPAGTPNAS